jgi:uncharacterized membrane protein
MGQEPSTAKAQKTNIETVVRLEAEDEKRVSHIDKLSEAIGSFAGTNFFIMLQLGAVAIWITVNTGVLPPVPAFDPYPFSLLSAVLSLEGVLLMAFVLIRQNRMSLRADRRGHLDLQINLLAEKEATKVIQLLHRMSRHMGIEEDVSDAETKELGEDTAVDELARDLLQRVGKDRDD